MDLTIRPAVERDIPPVTRLMGEYASVRASTKRCKKVARQLILAAVRSRRKHEAGDRAWVACDGEGRVRAFCAGAWAYMHGLFEDVPTFHVTHLGGYPGALRAFVSTLKREAKGGHLLCYPCTEVPYTTTPRAGHRLGEALGKMGFRPVGTIWAVEV